MDKTKQKIQSQLEQALAGRLQEQVDAAQEAENQQVDEPIDIGEISQTQPMNVPDPVQSQDRIGELSANISQNINQETDAERRQRDIQNRILENQQQLGQREQIAQEVSNQLGLGEARERFGQAQGELEQLGLQSRQAPLVVQEEAAGRGQTRFTTNVRESDAQRAIAIRALSAQGEFQAASRNLEMLKQERDTQVEMKFAPIEAEQETLRLFYQMNRDTLARQDKKQEQKLGILLEERDRLIQAEKQTQKTIQNFSLNAAANGADAQTVQAIQNAESVEDAIALGGNNIVDPSVKLQVKQMEESIRQFNLNFGLQVDQIEATKNAAQAQRDLEQAVRQGQFAKSKSIAVSQNQTEARDIRNINTLVNSPYFVYAFGTAREQIAVVSGDSEITGQEKPTVLNLKAREAVNDLEAIYKGISGQETLDRMSQLKGTASESDAQFVVQSVGTLNDDDATAAAKRQALIDIAMAKKRIQERRLIEAQDPMKIGAGAGYWNSLPDNQ